MPKSRKITLKKALELAVKEFSGYHPRSVHEYVDPCDRDHVIYSVTLGNGDMVAIVGVKKNGGDIAWVSSPTRNAKKDEINVGYSA